jgi:methylated-DNA-protein-cysteine methyltransferase-like protein
VVNAKGILSGKHAFPGEKLMQQLLENEGIKVINDQVVEMDKHYWNPTGKR